MNSKFFTIFVYIAVIIFFTNDLVQDFVYYDYQFELGWMFHVELVCTLLMFYLLIRQIYTIRQINKKLHRASNTINNLQGEVASYIEQKFSKWQLTKAEKEVAWLILKGFSSKEIAGLRQVSEKTVEQQSCSIYKKSNSKNRHNLVSQFLEEFIQ